MKTETISHVSLLARISSNAAVVPGLILQSSRSLLAVKQLKAGACADALDRACSRIASSNSTRRFRAISLSSHALLL